MELSRSYSFCSALFCKMFLQIGQIDNETKKEEISCENNDALQLEC